jgi:hypothetical protein
MTNEERATALAGAARQLLLPDLLTAEDLGRALHVTPNAARGLLRRGAVPGRKVGRRWFAVRAEVLRLVASGGASWRVVPTSGGGA